jgi:Na+-driven multidrug efflux pump
MTAILFTLRAPIITLFGAEGVTRELIVLFCGPLALAFFFNGVIFVANAAFNNMGRPFRSTWINWGRHTIGTVTFVLAGGAMFGAAGVLIGQAVGGVIFAGIAAVMVRRMMDGEGGAPAPEKPFERQARLMSLLHRRR